MFKNDYLIGRLLKDGEVVALGQISYISSNSSKVNKDISFINQEEYSEFFSGNKKSSSLEGISTYVDMQLGYVLELYKYSED